MAVLPAAAVFYAAPSWRGNGPLAYRRGCRWGIGRSQSINVWLPLDTVGSLLPSLDIIPAFHKKMRTLALMRDRVYRDDTFAASFGSTVTPILDPGDALVFDQFTLHRTQHSPAIAQIDTRKAALRAAFDPADVQRSRGPASSSFLGDSHQPLNFSLSQVLASVEVNVAASLGSDNNSGIAKFH